MSDLVVDACCVINLLAAGKIVPVSASSGTLQPDGTSGLEYGLHVPINVGNETLYILQPDEDEPSRLVKVEVDLSSFMEAGIFSECKLDGSEETALFVQLAATLDDGEAASLAIANSRRWSLATDDRVAARLAREMGTVVIGTPELTKAWAESSKATEQEIAKAIDNIQTRAKFVPRQDAPEAEWWFRHV